MFRKSDKSIQLNMFSSHANVLTDRALKTYTDEQKWHNQFRKQVTHRIDEEIFRTLFIDGFGAPNAPIRILVGMMILKEAQGWSDAQLFEQCQFNILVRSALGLLNMDDPVPAASTYYLLRKRIVLHENEGNANLIEKVFSQVTKSQALEFQINGNKIRMDSKLLGSNIAWYSRYELIHEMVKKVYQRLKSEIDCFLTDVEISFLTDICSESGEKVSYRSNKSEIEKKLSELGIVIYKIISQMKDTPSDLLQTLTSLFHQQYGIENEAVSLLPKQEISAQGIQSPHDTDCHYRKKGDDQIKGYSINVSETCEPKNAFDLISSVLTEPASAVDSDFLQPAITATQKVVCQEIKTVNADGAYHSADNQNFCTEDSIDLVVSAIQGKPSRYDLAFDENEELIVTDLQTNTIVPCRKVETRKDDAEPKWAIQTDEKKYRYFTQKEADTCLLRKQIAARTKEELNRRNNVEATIFQLGFHYPNNKSRYRGLIKHKIWANVRCMWVNFVRIFKFLTISVPNYAQKVGKSIFLPHFSLNFVKMGFEMVPDKIRLFHFSENRLRSEIFKNDFL